LLEGVNKKNTKHVVIEINEDEDEDTAADTNNIETSHAHNPEVLPAEPTDEPVETTETTNQDTNQDNKNDNPHSEE